VLYAAGIIISSHMPTVPGTAGINRVEGGDKLSHLAIYFLFSLFFLLALKYEGYRYPVLYIITITFVAGFGALDEAHQFFVPGRKCEIMDFVTDALAAMLACIVFMSLTPKTNHTKP